MSVNTRILTTEFEYSAQESFQDLLQLLEEHGQNAKVIAGGTDLIIQMKKKVVSPRHLINIMKLSDLHFIKEEDKWLRIGATTRWSEIVNFCDKKQKYAALYEASHSIGKVQVRNMGTIGGNLCTASPAADSAPALLVLNSQVKLVNLHGERILNLEDFFKGVNTTVLAPNEIMTEVRIPVDHDGRGSAFKKIIRVGSDISKISCAVALKRKGDVCTYCQVAMGAVAPVPLRIKGVSDLVVDKKVTPALVEKMGKTISKAIKPISDVRSTSEYRKSVAATLFKDVFWSAWRRAGSEE